MKIFKYSIPVDGISTIAMQKDASILKARYYAGNVDIWALVDPEAELETVTFHTYGTGHQIDNPEALQYINTVFLDHIGLVFHVFKVLS